MIKVTVSQEVPEEPGAEGATTRPPATTAAQAGQTTMASCSSEQPQQPEQSLRSNQTRDELSMISIPKGQRESVCWEGLGHRVRPAFRRLGGAIGRRPYVFIAFSFILTAVCSAGFAVLVNNTSMTIWNTVGTESSFQREWIDGNWASAESTSVILMESSGDDLLSIGCLEEIRRLRERALESMPQICLATGDSKDRCVYSLVDLLQLSNVTDNNVRPFLILMMANNDGVLPFSVTNVASVRTDGGKIEVSALRVLFTKLDKRNSKLEAFDRDLENLVLDWTLESCRGSKLFVQTESSYADVVNQATVDDSNLMGACIGIMLVYLAVMLGRSTNCVESKALLGQSVVVAIGFSFTVSFGVGALFGVEFTQMSMLSIFILLGVGIDDAFIVSDAFERNGFTHDLVLRMEATLEEVGPAIFLTSLTDFAAFICGITFPVPVIRWFNISAAIAVFAVFCFQLTLFAPLLALNFKRQSARRCDMCPCFTVSQFCWPAVATEDPGDEITVTSSKSTTLADLSKEDTGWIVNLIRFMLTPCGSAVCILPFLAIISLNIWSLLTRLTTSSNPTDYLPQDSFVVDFLNANDRTFGRRLTFGFYSRSLNLGLDADLDRHGDGVERLAKMDYAVKPRARTWLDSFRLWRNCTADACESGENGKLLSGFLTSPLGESYTNDMFSIDGQDMVNTRSWLWATAPGSDLTDKALVMEKSREALGGDWQSCANQVCQDFVWAEWMDTGDNIRSAETDILTSMVSAIVVLSVVCFLFLPPTAAVATVISIVLVNVNILGLLMLWGVTLNVAMASYLTLALGFSVDYSAHIAESFCLRLYAEKGGLRPDPALAMMRALRTTGASVMNGGISTALAVVVLAFSKTKGFVDLFKTFLYMVILGLAHGMIFIPILLVSFRRIADALCSTFAAKERTID